MSMLTLAAALIAAQPAAPHPVIEFRQYKIVHGKRDAMIALFEREFVESQEADGMRLIGQFRDLGDPDRFTWIRAFPNMDARGPSLTAFYFGPVWKAHRDEANPMLFDNDNVLLLRPAYETAGFSVGTAARPSPGSTGAQAGLVVATIAYLWKAPDEGFTAFFRDRLAPALRTAGLPVLGGYVPEETPNNFPRLPVRQGEKLFVWFTRTNDEASYAAATKRLKGSAEWRFGLGAALADFEERPEQILKLAPTPRSALR